MLAACKILSIRNSEMSLLKYVNSILLLKGGAKKTLFLRLNSTNDCMSYPSTIALADKLAGDVMEKMLTWKDAVENKAHPGYYFVGDNLDIRLESRLKRSSSLSNCSLQDTCPWECSEKCISTGSNYS